MGHLTVMTISQLMKSFLPLPGLTHTVNIKYTVEYKKAAHKIVETIKSGVKTREDSWKFSLTKSVVLHYIK